jgi:hypothetical protein
VPTPVSRTLHFAAVFWSPGNTVPVVPRAAFSHCRALGSDFPAQSVSAFTSPLFRGEPATWNDANDFMQDDDTGFRCACSTAQMTV